MKDYDIYKHARDKAWRFLIDNKITELPINLLNICQTNGYKLLSDSSKTFLSDGDRGITFLKDDRWHIVLNASDSVAVRRYTLAHELGHIYLNHPLRDMIYGRSFGVQRTPKTPEEYQAERFAIDVLAPACVLYGLNLRTADEIASVCNISMQAATYRAERMAVLYERNRFLSHPLEQAVFEQFRNFIDKTE